jgi:hypothetical protein
MFEKDRARWLREEGVKEGGGGGERHQRQAPPLISPTPEHILQDCRNLQSLRDETWPEQTSTHEKLYGPVEELKRTTISRAKCSQAIDKNTYT